MATEDKDNLTVMQQALRDYADGLADDLSPIRERLDAIADIEDPVEAQDEIQSLRDDLPKLLAIAMDKDSASDALSDSMATMYHNGMVGVNEGLNEADQVDAEPLDKPAPAGKVAGMILSSGLLENADDVKKDIEDILDRADWAAANTKAVVVDDLDGNLGDLDVSDPSFAEKIALIVAGLAANGLAQNGDVQINSDTQNQMAEGYGQQTMLNDNVEDYPAAELYRDLDRKEWRNWPERWTAAGGEIVPWGTTDDDEMNQKMQLGGYPEGRMVALMNDPIWLEISRFGTPYAPFDYNSGMGKAPLSLDEATALGLIGSSGDDDVAQPSDVESFNGNVQFSANIDPQFKKVLLEHLGEDFTEAGGVISNGTPEDGALLNSSDMERLTNVNKAENMAMVNRSVSKIFNGGPGSGRRPGQDSDADKYARLVAAIRSGGKDYKRESTWGSKDFGGPFHSIFRGKRLGKFKLEGDTLRTPTGNVNL